MHAVLQCLADVLGQLLLAHARGGAQKTAGAGLVQVVRYLGIWAVAFFYEPADAVAAQRLLQSMHHIQISAVGDNHDRVPRHVPLTFCDDVAHTPAR